MSELNLFLAVHKDKIREITNALVQDRKLKRNYIADYLGIEKKQQWSFYKFVKGGNRPKFIGEQADQMAVKLTHLLEKPDLAPVIDLKDKKITEEHDLPGHYKVFIPFDIDLPITPYDNPDAPVSSIQGNEVPHGFAIGIVTYNNTSRHDADGEIYVAEILMSTDIDPGTRLTIRRIDKRLWTPNRYYIIVDSSHQISIQELVPGDNESTVGLVSSNNPSGPHKMVLLDRILAIFSIVEGNCIPKPKRNIPIK